MVARSFAFAGILVALVGQLHTVAATPPPSAASATPQPCASTDPDLSGDLLKVYAYDLESPSLLNFLTALAALPAEDQKPVFDAAVAAAASPQERDVQAAVARLCPSADAVDATSRAAMLISSEWDHAGNDDAKRADEFSDVLATAVSALASGETLAPEEQRFALLPFARVFAPEAPPPTPAASGACSRPNVDAHTLHVIHPKYPAVALATRTSGMLRVLVALSDTGSVRSAKLFSEAPGDRSGSEDLAEAAVLAAATTTYAPEIRDCVAVPGKYVFRAHFTLRR